MAHVAHQHEDLHGIAWCGADVRNIWAFQGAEHAAQNGRQNGSVPICEECAAEIAAALRFAATR